MNHIPRKHYIFELTAMLLLLCIGSILILSWPRTLKKGILVPNQPELGFGYYHGFGLTNEPTIWGRKYVRFETALTLPEDGLCTVYCESPAHVTQDGHELYQFVAHYPNGAIRAEGLCELTYMFDQPYSMGDVWSGTFFDPQGKSQSELEDGSGVETYWTSDGTKVWELVLLNHQRVQLKFWHRNGQFRGEHLYQNGKKEGLVQFFNEDGSQAGTILYENGLEKARTP